jgi:hypothetical protein
MNVSLASMPSTNLARVVFEPSGKRFSGRRSAQIFEIDTDGSHGSLKNSATKALFVEKLSSR